MSEFCNCVWCGNTRQQTWLAGDECFDTLTTDERQTDRHLGTEQLALRIYTVQWNTRQYSTTKLITQAQTKANKTFNSGKQIRSLLQTCTTFPLLCIEQSTVTNQQNLYPWTTEGGHVYERVWNIVHELQSHANIVLHKKLKGSKAKR